MTTWQDLQSALQSALEAPEEADCIGLWDLMEKCLAPLPDARCLEIGGTAIALIAEVLHLKMQCYRQAEPPEEPLELELDSGGFPILDDEDDQWERHTMSLNLDDDEEDWGKTKKPRSRLPNSTSSVAAPVPPKRVLEMLQKLAGDEDPAAWSSAIAKWLDRQKSRDPIPVAKLQRSLRKLSIVELWMGLLLGKFSLQQQQTTEEDFYRELTEADIWIIAVGEKPPS